jgi:hypothetical protein
VTWVEWTAIDRRCPLGAVRMFNSAHLTGGTHKANSRGTCMPVPVTAGLFTSASQTGEA